MSSLEGVLASMATEAEAGAKAAECDGESLGQGQEPSDEVVGQLWSGMGFKEPECPNCVCLTRAMWWILEATKADACVSCRLCKMADGTAAAKKLDPCEPFRTILIEGPEGGINLDDSESDTASAAEFSDRVEKLGAVAWARVVRTIGDAGFSDHDHHDHPHPSVPNKKQKCQNFGDFVSVSLMPAERDSPPDFSSSPEHSNR